jgi:hypothetical protein
VRSQLLTAAARTLDGAAEQLERLQTRWRLSDGMLGSVYCGAQCVDPEPLVADLGDTAPFLAALGFRAQALELARCAASHLTRGLYRRGERAYLFDNHDLLLGWLELYEQTGERWLLEHCVAALATVKRECEVRGRLVDWAEPGRRAWRASSFNAGFIEVAVDLYAATREPVYLEWAGAWAARLLRARSFQRHGLWSRFDTPRFEAIGAVLGRVSRQGPRRMFKDNTNCVWALLSLFLKSKQPEISAALNKFVSVLAELVQEHGQVPQYPGRAVRFDLAANVFVADLLADIAHFMGHEPALELACKVVDVIELRRWQNGLLPRGAGQPGDHLDIMTDFGVALCKLDALRPGNGFFDLAEHGWRSTWKLHQSENGLVLSVDSGGRVVDDRIIVKYQFLATKALLITERARVYDDPRLWRLLRDR